MTSIPIPVSAPRRARTLLAGLPLAVLGLAGCSSAPEIPGGGPAPDAASAAQAYAECLRGEGMENVMVGPDGWVGFGVGADASAAQEDSDVEVTWDDAQQELFEKAETVCHERVPDYAPPPSALEPDQAQLARAQAFAACARENGFADFPDPDELGQLNVPAGTSKEQFLALVTACRDTIAPEPDDSGGFSLALPGFGETVDPAWMDDLVAILAEGAGPRG